MWLPKPHPIFSITIMTKKEAISKFYKLRNETYAELEIFNHPDFMYWKEKKNLEIKLQMYEEFLNTLINLE